jgi:hypothetical protein
MPIGPTLEAQEDLQVIMSGTTDEVSEIITLNQNNVIASIDETNGELDSVLELQKDLYVITSDFNNQVYRLKDGDYGDIAVSNSGTIMTIENMGENATVTTGTYTSKVNQDLLIKVRKSTAGTITKGQVVYIVGSTGNHLTVELARADVETTSAYTIGIAATTITNTSDGFVVQNGRLTQLSTLPTATFADGDAVYLSEATAGGYRVGIPEAPNHGVFLGFVIRANNGNAGEMDVRVDNYQELEELSDVYITSPLANDFLIRNATNTRWENTTSANAKTVLGINNVDNTSDLNKPISTATQTALDGKVSDTGDTMTGTLILPIVKTNNSGTEANASEFGNSSNQVMVWANNGGGEIKTKNDTRIRMQSPMRFDAVAGEFTINKMPIVIRCETDLEDANAKGTFIEWDQLFRTGVTYDYGIAESAYRNWVRGGSVGPAPTFTVATTGQKRVMWFGQHYESAAGTGETTHMHGNWETCQADMSTIVTRIQVGYGEDWTEVSVVNADFAISKNAKFFLASDKNVYMSLNGTNGDVSWVLTSLTVSGDVSVPDEAYDATSWNGSLEVPTKNAIRDKIELIPTETATYTNKTISLGSNTISGTLAEFNTALTGDDFATGGGTASGTNTGDQNIFSTIAVAGQSNVVADTTSDTLTLVAGSNITLTTNATNDSITIASTGGGSAETFETVSKNLKTYPASLNYTLGVLTSIVYTLPVGTITKTLNYTLGTLTSIVLSGDTPAGIDLTKTLGYTGSELTSITYS